MQPPCKMIDSDSTKKEETMYQTRTFMVIKPFELTSPVPQSKVQSIAAEFKERLLKLECKEMPFADKLESKDPQFVSEFANTIFENMRKDEENMQLQPDYLTKVQLPTEVKETSRAFLVEWIIDVHRKFRLKPETLYITVYLIDRFLSIHQIKKSQLHILGVTALLIATKYEEIYPPDLKDLL